MHGYQATRAAIMYITQLEGLIRGRPNSETFYLSNLILNAEHALFRNLSHLAHRLGEMLTLPTAMMTLSCATSKFYFLLKKCLDRQ